MVPERSGRFPLELPQKSSLSALLVVAVGVDGDLLDQCFQGDEVVVIAVSTVHLPASARHVFSGLAGAQIHCLPCLCLSFLSDRFFGAFHIIDQSDKTWLKAGRLAYNLKKKGKTIHLSDCYVAVIAKEHDCKIFTLNRHFQEIQSLTDIELI